MRPAHRHATRRGLIVGSASALAAGELLRVEPARARQMDRDLIDLLANQEQALIALYEAILREFDEEAFAAAGLPNRTRDGIEEILAAETAHLAVVTRPEGPPATSADAVIPEDLLEALREVARTENLAIASYAFVVPELDRERLIPELLGIHSVEARHAAWLATLLDEEPFPDAIDAPLALAESTVDMGQAPEDLAPTGTPVANTDVDIDIAPIIDVIARELNVSSDEIEVVSVTPQVWPDSSLGCPQPDMLYAQVITPGYAIVVEIAGERIEFHADERGTVVRCP